MVSIYHMQHRDFIALIRQLTVGAGFSDYATLYLHDDRVYSTISDIEGSITISDYPGGGIHTIQIYIPVYLPVLKTLSKSSTVTTDITTTVINSTTWSISDDTSSPIQITASNYPKWMCVDMVNTGHYNSNRNQVHIASVDFAAACTGLCLNNSLVTFTINNTLLEIVSHSELARIRITTQPVNQPNYPDQSVTCQIIIKRVKDVLPLLSLIEQLCITVTDQHVCLTATDSDYPTIIFHVQKKLGYSSC